MDQLSADTSLPAVAVVIIGRNEGQRLRRCLESVQRMSYPTALLKIVYVDSSSTDQSVALAASLGVSSIVLEGPTTAALGRNAGWTSVDAPFVLFLDGDTILEPNFVRKALAALTDPMVAGVFGTRREIDVEGSLYNAVFDLDWPSTSGPALFFGGDALVRTEALRAVGGYNPALIAGEEPDMCRRMRGLGFTILRIDAPMTLHDLDMHTFRQYWRRSVRTGYAFAEISSLYAETDDPLWLPESRKNCVRAAFWILAPVLSLGASFVWHTPIIFLAFLLLATLLVARTVMGIRSRAPNLKQAIAYGVHSHFQQIPILFGQIRFWMVGRTAQRAGLIEYKSP